MKKNLKKITFATTLVLGTNSLYAANDSAQMRNLENRVNALEQRRNAGGMINPPGRPQVRNGANLFLFGDFLLWNAHENGLCVAARNQSSSVNLSDADIKTIHSNWDPGLRLGLGYNLPHDGWDLRFTWLRFNSQGNKKIHAHSNDSVYPSRGSPADLLISSGPCSKAHSHWRIKLNQLDLDLGREFFVSKWLTLRPHFGIRTDWIHQRWHSKFRNFANMTLPNTLDIKYEDQWWAMGPAAGLDTQWGLGSGFSLFGDIAASILYGFHDIHFKDKDQPAQPNTDGGVLANVRNTYRISHSVLDLAMGLRYDVMLYNDIFHLGLEIGWEHHVYLNQNQFPVFVDNVSRGLFVSNQGDLTLQGWTFAARFDF